MTVQHDIEMINIKSAFRIANAWLSEVQYEAPYFGSGEMKKTFPDKFLNDKNWFCGKCSFMDLFNELIEKFVPKFCEWIPADEPPKTDDYILLSFENFTIPMVGRYEKFEDGSGNYYLGDCDEKDTCLANNLFVNGWQPLPAPYRPDQEEPEQPKAAWKEAMMRTFLGRNT